MKCPMLPSSPGGFTNAISSSPVRNFSFFYLSLSELVLCQFKSLRKQTDLNNFDN